MKKLFTTMLAALMSLSLVACSTDTSAKEEEKPAETPAEETAEGTVFNIYAWNEEFKGFFEKYYTVPEGVTVNWVIVPSDNGAYQEALDAALLNQADAAADDKVDMFLAEADYILKYTNSDATQDITALGVTDFSNTYKYTVEAASDDNGVVKGVSFQCCPSGLIYRRSIALDVLGTDDPAEVQEALGSWDKFNAVAADAAAKGYLMTPSYAETYRVFSNNTTSPWVVDGKLNIDGAIEAWMDQAEEYVANGYTLTAGVWDDEKNAEMGANGKAMCFFGPAWYFNFCMGPAHDEAMGDWAVIEGPQAHFWGGTWLLAPAGTDNPTMLADVLDTFINDEEVCANLIEKESQFTNNVKVNTKYAEDPEYGSEFLGGQNDTAVFAGMAGNIKFQNQTIYDQLMNEKLQTYFVEFLKGEVDKETALKNFYAFIADTYPAVTVPAE